MMAAASSSPTKCEDPKHLPAPSSEVFIEACGESQRLLAIEHDFRTSLNSAPWPFTCGKRLAEAAINTQRQRHRHSGDCRTCSRQESLNYQRRLEAIAWHKGRVPISQGWPQSWVDRYARGQQPGREIEHHGPAERYACRSKPDRTATAKSRAEG